MNYRSLGSKTPSESRAPSVKPEDAVESVGDGRLLQFPSASELNGRLRRLISAYQREFKREEARQAAAHKRNEHRGRIEQVIKEREQRKWTRKEETDFLRTVLAYGVEYSDKEHRYVWDRFRQMAKLDKKYDDSLTEYFLGFVVMCKKVTGQKLTEAEGMPGFAD